jgi:hypothetical protein
MKLHLLIVAVASLIFASTAQAQNSAFSLANLNSFTLDFGSQAEPTGNDG